MKKNRKQYDTLKNEKEILEKKKKEKEEEVLEQNKIRVNAMKKVEDKDILNEKNSTKSNRNDKSEKETMDTLLSPQQKKNYFQSKDLIEKYKNMVDELMKEEQLVLEKIEKAKKMPKNRSASEGRMKIFTKKIKNKDMKNRTKSNYKFDNKDEKKNEVKSKTSQ